MRRGRFIRIGAAVLIVMGMLLFRLYLTDKAWHVDMWSNAGWGEWIHNHGPGGFYDNTVWTYSWPTQLPLINSVYAVNKTLHTEILGRLAFTEYQLNKILPGEKVFWLTDFVYWFGYGKIDTEIPFQIGYLVTMKLWPILADLGLAGLILWITGKPKPALLYLISPFSWYLSSLWGQYDQVAVLLAFTAFACLRTRWAAVASACLAISVLIKPTTLILVPFYGYLFLRMNRRKWQEWVIAGILPVTIFLLTTAPYTHKHPLVFAVNDLSKIVFQKSEPRVSSNSFNWWRLLIGDRAVNSTDQWFIFSWQIWGLMAFGLLNLAAVVAAEKRKFTPEAVWWGVFLVSAGGFIFLTGMLERYLFAGVVSGLIVAGFKPKMLPEWIVMSLIFWLNLYYHWWVPGEFEILKQILLWQNSLPTRLLAGIMVLIFGRMIYRQSRSK